MRNKINQLSIFLIILVTIILINGCSTNKPTNNNSTTSNSTNNFVEKERMKHSDYILPIEKRDFYIGMVPIPKSIPETTFDDITKAYEEVGQIAEVTMVWGSPSGIGLYEKLKQNKVITAVRVYGLKPIITLNLHTIKNVPGQGLKLVIDAPEGIAADISDTEFRKLWVSEAEKIAKEFKPEYFSLGNEINDYFYLNPDDLDNYLTLIDEAYAAIKKASPKTKILVVFSYTHLIDNNQWDLLKIIDNRVDIIGLTTYPWKHFDNPEEISDDYYTRIKGYTNKPVAFTEIGWVSSIEAESFEKEQADFLVRFLKLTQALDVEMLNWLFLHEINLTGGIGGSVFSPETSSIALKKADGTKKEIYNLWLDLKEVECTD